MASIEKRLPGITRAYLAMERCNGGINRYRGERSALNYLEQCIVKDGLDVAMDLPAISAYFAGLTDDELLLVVDGEYDEAHAFMRSAPAGADAFLEAMFDRAD
ncbi:conserved protein of unknown function [Hyphomicrobium sp. 1Nfss2.1]|uniref:hypothetical protein n=1 Tax=Hyphomicrobium sp. 1Nfss2.1 TaxID=3413936 RepID=UPI003C7E0B35